MNEKIMKVNALCRLHIDDVKRIPKNELEHLVNRQLFRDAVEVMLREKENLPIQIIKTIEEDTPDDVYRLEFWIIEMDALNKLTLKAMAHDDLMQAFKVYNLEVSSCGDLVGKCKCGKPVYLGQNHCDGCAQKLDWKESKVCDENKL